MYGALPKLYPQITTLIPHPRTDADENDSSYASNLFSLPIEEFVEKGSVKPMFVESWKRDIEAWGADIQRNVEHGAFQHLHLTSSHWLAEDFFAHLHSGAIIAVIVNNFTSDHYCSVSFPDLSDALRTNASHVFESSAEVDALIRELNEASFTTHQFLLFRLYQMDKLILMPEEHPAKVVLHQLMDIVMERIAISKQMQNQPHFLCAIPKRSDTTLHSKHSDRALYCFRTSEGWRCGAVEGETSLDRAFQIVQMNINRTQNVVIDSQKNIVKHQGVFVTSQLHPDSDYILMSPEEQKYHRNNIVKVDFLFYTGFSEGLEVCRNSFTFTGDIDLHRKPITLLGLRQDCAVLTNVEDVLMFDEGKMEMCFQEIGKIFAVFKERLATRSPVTIPLFQPQSERDKLEVINAILKEYEKNPDAHAEEIAYIAEQLNPSFSEEEVKELIKVGLAKKTGKEEFMVEPKAILAKLCEETRGRYLEAVRSELNFLEVPVQESPSDEKEKEKEAVAEGNGNKTQPFASDEKEKEKTSRAEAVQKARLPKDEVEKRRRREQHKWEQYKERTKAEASAPSGEKEEPKFKLSPEDRATVDSIYKGQPLKSKEFKAFAMGLLTKKVEAIGATPSKTRKGSHVKFHLKREGGPSTGMTFVVQHRKKDHQGSLKAQKDVLDHIFDL